MENLQKQPFLKYTNICFTSVCLLVLLKLFKRLLSAVRYFFRFLRIPYVQFSLTETVISLTKLRSFSELVEKLDVECQNSRDKYLYSKIHVLAQIQSFKKNILFQFLNFLISVVNLSHINIIFSTNFSYLNHVKS
jgi:hypothetical protein